VGAEQVSQYLARLESLQHEIMNELADLPYDEFRYATGSSRWNTVRRVLLRFGDHVREHTTQLLAAREAIGARQTMAQRILAQAQQAYGCLMGAVLGLSDEDLDQVPEPGEWSPRQVLEHLIDTQQGYLELIRGARERREAVERD